MMRPSGSEDVYKRQLVTKGVPFRDAYAVSGQLVRLCVERGETLDTLPLEEYRKRCV